MKKSISLFLALALLLSLAGCSRKNAASVEEYDRGYYMADNRVYQETSAAAGNTYATNRTASVSEVELPQNRKWVITMSMETETDDLDEALAALTEQIKAMEGYIEGQNINNSASYRRTRSASLTIRIPSDKVDAFAAGVSGLANVVSTSRNVRDITLSYSDTEGRVTALKTEQARLLELMEQAENMSDLLEIESRLTEVRRQLESYASTLRLYDNQVDYATLSLYINEVQKYTPVEEEGFWKRITTGLADSIVNLAETVVDAVVWLIVDLPYLAVLGLLGWGAFAAVKRILRSKKAKKEKAE